MKREPSLRVVLSGLGLLTAAMFALAFAAIPNDVAMAASAAHVGGPFELMDQQGRPVTNETLKGKPFAIFFGFTRCPQICPTTMRRMTTIRQRLVRPHDLELVFVSVDPEHDTPERLASFIEPFDPTVIALTGNAAQVERMISTYQTFVQRAPLAGDDYTLNHGSVVFLMNAEGSLVATVNQLESDESALSKLRHLTNE